MLLVLLLLIVLLILVMRPLLLLVPRVRLLVLAHVPEAAVRAHARVPRPHETGNAETVWDTARVRHVSHATSDPRTAHSPVRRMSWFLGRGSRRRRCSEGRGFESCPQGMNIIRSCAIAAGGEWTGRPYVFNRKRGGAEEFDIYFRILKNVRL